MPSKHSSPHFREHGYVILKDAFTPDEVTYFREIYDRDREQFGSPNCWHPFSNQMRNCNALVTSPEFDQLLRHPKILPAIEFLMGGPVCFAEICLRHMSPYDGEPHQRFHRDRPHWEAHPLRMDYLQLMVYLTDVDEGTHCFSISPESVDEPIFGDSSERRAQWKCRYSRTGRHRRAFQHCRSAYSNGPRHATRAENSSSVLWPPFLAHT